jgi:cytosine/adenosine deaminase-related metal-dependent hydrolase
VRLNTPFYAALRTEIERLGGINNAHLHLCRAYTLADTEALLGAEKSKDISSISLAAKHAIIPMVHASHLYEPEKLKARVRLCLDEMEAAGTTRASTLVDVTDDRVQLSALDAFLELKAERAGVLDLHVGSYSPLGFVDSEPRRWQLVREGVDRADFIGALPERDDRGRYPGHIGYRDNCRRFLALAAETGKTLHVHVDQKNHPGEHGTGDFLDVMDEMGVGGGSGEPSVWLIHVISPSTYPEAEFRALLARMREKNVGVICCPSAALSMRQIRALQTPAYNSIARVLEMLGAGIQVRIASDNICDLTSPSGTPDLMAEMFVLSNALRFYDIPVLAKLAAGAPLDAAEIARIAEHLARDGEEAAKGLDFPGYA